MRNNNRAIFAMAALSLAAAAGLWAQADAGEEAAVDEAARAPQQVDVSFTGSSFAATPRVNGVATSVTVGCDDGTHIDREFEGVGTALVELVRADGSFVNNARCDYEVLVHPPVDQEAMQWAEENDDDVTLERLSREEQALTVVSTGSFNVVNGASVALEDE